MFTDEFLQDVLKDVDVMRVPYDFKFIMLKVIEITLEQYEREGKNATIYDGLPNVSATVSGINWKNC